MSSRHQKEKRLRPQRTPYKRDHFNQSKYLLLVKTNETLPAEDDLEDYKHYTNYDDANFDDMK